MTSKDYAEGWLTGLFLATNQESLYERYNRKSCRDKRYRRGLIRGITAGCQIYSVQRKTRQMKTIADDPPANDAQRQPASSTQPAGKAT